MPKRVGRKSAAQTPAPPKERIKGSSVNPKDSASSKESAKSIVLSDKTIEALKNKVQEYNQEHTKKVTLATLKAVYRRGAGAYSSTHRPTITGGAPNSRNAWAMARVNKFLQKKAGNKVKKAYVQDDDLLQNGGEVGDVESREILNVQIDSKGSGVLIYCTSTQRCLVLKRSEIVNQPNTWGMVSGSVEKGETYEEAVKRESLEEIGYELGEIVPVYNVEEYDFQTFIHLVDEEFVPTLNPEHTEYMWCKIDEIPSKKHYGLSIMLIESNIKNKIYMQTVHADCGCQHYVDGGEILKPAPSVEEVAQKHGVSIEEIEMELQNGMKHELEHTDNTEVARTIALQHLEETPDYYTQLDKLMMPQTSETAEPEMVEKIVCKNCGWSWSLDEGGEDMYLCHKCGYDNTPYDIVENNMPYSLWAYDSTKDLANGWNFGDVESANKYANELGIHHNNDVDFEIRQRFSGKILLKKDDIKNLLNGSKKIDEFYYDGGNVEEVEDMEYLNMQKADAQAVLMSDTTKIAKIMIAQAYLDYAKSNQEKAEEYDEWVVWNETIKIWQDCIKKIKNNKFYREKNMMIYSKGGLAYGNSHDKGGMPLVVKSTGQNIEIEGGEGVINKTSMQMAKKLEFEGKKMTPCEIISKINEMGGGVKFKCNDVKEIIAKDGHF